MKINNEMIALLKQFLLDQENIFSFGSFVLCCPSMAHLFQFEGEFADSLRCIPMQVRYNLDHCGVKLKLLDWNRFTLSERTALVNLLCDTADEQQVYRTRLHELVAQYGGDRPDSLPIDPHPDWQAVTTIPESVQAMAQTAEMALSLEQWASLLPLQRFALIKLSRSNHENHNFVPALQEFGLWGDRPTS